MPVCAAACVRVVMCFYCVFAFVCVSECVYLRNYEFLCACCVFPCVSVFVCV